MDALTPFQNQRMIVWAPRQNEHLQRMLGGIQHLLVAVGLALILWRYAPDGHKPEFWPARDDG